MTKKKSIITVKDATKMAYHKMDGKFHGIRLCQAVRHLTGRAFLMDSTILRRLRELRDEDPENFNYRVVDNEQSIYKKHLKITETV
jgi:hypothetical protein